MTRERASLHRQDDWHDNCRLRWQQIARKTLVKGSLFVAFATPPQLFKARSLGISPEGLAVKARGKATRH